MQKTNNIKSTESKKNEKIEESEKRTKNCKKIKQKLQRVRRKHDPKSVEVPSMSLQLIGLKDENPKSINRSEFS